MPKVKTKPNKSPRLSAKALLVKIADLEKVIALDAETNKALHERVAEQDTELVARTSTIASLRTEVREVRQCFDESKKAKTAAEAQFAALKEHIVGLERANAEMRGYIDRVQEDDVVGEDLVQTGDPDGHATLVPKRQHRKFGVPEFRNAACENGQSGSSYFDRISRSSKPPAHWVNYGSRP